MSTEKLKKPSLLSCHFQDNVYSEVSQTLNSYLLSGQRQSAANYSNNLPTDNVPSTVPRTKLWSETQIGTLIKNMTKTLHVLQHKKCSTNIPITGISESEGTERKEQASLQSWRNCHMKK